MRPGRHQLLRGRSQVILDVALEAASYGVDGQSACVQENQKVHCFNKKNKLKVIHNFLVLP